MINGFYLLFAFAVGFACGVGVLLGILYRLEQEMNVLRSEERVFTDKQWEKFEKEMGLR